MPAAPFPVPGGMYAPHIYTGVFDTTDFSSGDPALLAPSMERAAVEAAAWGTPLLVGEYGIDPASPVANRWITAELDLQDRLRAHSTFWLWEEISSGHWGLYDGEGRAGRRRIERTTALSRVFARGAGDVLEHTDAAAVRHACASGRAARRRRAVRAGAAISGGFTLRCDGAQVTAHRTRSRGVVSFRCRRGRGEHLVELTLAS